MPRCTHWVIEIRIELLPSNATPAFPLHRYYKQAKPTPVLLCLSVCLFRTQPLKLKHEVQSCT
ncbi:hypothetical protein T02_10318 [Trichinella nativa]|uniref:Uncharacterized protein n=1 Tax=Trichinella nativa TaxID=6335 RepID=A0A0V1LI62_9BILA|nr:hypothetical protein T02_10318 [Trichinella nativa]